jgi:tetratricopeptide (TPR) repeat protein
MGQIILCETKEAENTYRFSSFHKEISTYEELCYYIREYFIFFVEEGIPDDLPVWMASELGILEVEQEWNTLSDGKERLKKIICCRNYFLPQEISMLLNQYDRYQKMTKSQRKAKLADEYLKQHRYEKALSYYLKAYKVEKDERTCYNIGVCYARGWDFEHAAGYFHEAYKYCNRKQMLDAYYTVLMLQGEEATVKIMAGNESSEFFGQWNEWKEQWREKQQEEDTIRNHQEKKRKLEQWKKDYRKEVE